MTSKDEILSRLTEIFRDTLDLEDLQLTGSTSAADVEGWDSLAHVRLMIAAERAFNCRFPTAEVTKLRNVGELVDLIARMVGGAA